MLVIAASIYLGCYRKKKAKEAQFLLTASEDISAQNGRGIYSLCTFPPSFAFQCLSMNESFLDLQV